jgi:hypothetical protein
MYVSSTRHESLVGLRCRRKRRSISGALTLDPSPHRDVIGMQAPLGKQLLHITVGKREAQVPADRKQDHLWFKLAPLEQSGNRWDTEHPSILAARLSGQASKVATLPFSSPKVFIGSDRIVSLELYL